MTSESNRNKNANRWQELADQLGLSEESQPTAALAKVEAPPPPPTPLERQVPAPCDEQRPEQAEPPVERYVPEMHHHLETPTEPVSPPTAEVETLDDTRPIQSEMTPDGAHGLRLGRPAFG